MSGERGFTVIEALIAFAILAVSLAVLYEAMGTSFRTLDRAASVDEAVLVAQSAMDTIVAERRLPQVLSGRSGVYGWRAEVLPQNGASSDVMALRLLRLQVRWAGGGRGVTLERTLLIPAPRVPQ
jgi:general secretion pathway protein I